MQVLVVARGRLPPPRILVRGKGSPATGTNPHPWQGPGRHRRESLSVAGSRPPPPRIRIRGSVRPQHIRREGRPAGRSRQGDGCCRPTAPGDVRMPRPALRDDRGRPTRPQRPTDSEVVGGSGRLRPSPRTHKRCRRTQIGCRSGGKGGPSERCWHPQYVTPVGARRWHHPQPRAGCRVSVTTTLSSRRRRPIAKHHSSTYRLPSRTRLCRWIACRTP